MTADRTIPSRARGGRVAAGALAGAVVWAGLVGAITVGLPSAGAWAQDSQIKGLVDRVDRLQRELTTLQRQVYRGEPPPAPEAAPPAAESGGSEGLGTTAAARLELRLSQLEAQIRELTGKIEEASYRQDQLRGQIDKLAADTDLRLQQLERGAAGQAAGAPGPMAGQPPAGTATASTGGQPGVLGTVPAEDVQAMKPTPVEPASPATGAAQGSGESAGAAAGAQTAYALPEGTPEEQYQAAFNLLSQANYGEAELALRSFIEQHPDHPLAGNAKYWLGETYYVRQDYQQAAITFAEGFQKYPDNPKAPDNLLKLGMALSSLGNKADACGTFAELMKRYPNAAVTVQQRAKQERQRLGCS